MATQETTQSAKSRQSLVEFDEISADVGGQRHRPLTAGLHRQSRGQLFPIEKLQFGDDRLSNRTTANEAGVMTVGQEQARQWEGSILSGGIQGRQERWMFKWYSFIRGSP